MDIELLFCHEIKSLIEERMERTLKGIEDTLRKVKEEVSVEDVQKIVKKLEPSFQILSQKWVLEILYMLLLRGQASFNELRRILDVSSRSLSLKLKLLQIAIT